MSNEDNAKSQAKAQYEFICNMVAALAQRTYSDKAFRICRAMQECDYVDAARMLRDMRANVSPRTRAIVDRVSNETWS